MKYYKAGEFANLIGITAVTLRQWDSRGWLKPHHRSPSGYRFYSEEQLKDYLSGKLILNKGSNNAKEIENG